MQYPEPILKIAINYLERFNIAPTPENIQTLIDFAETEKRAISGTTLAPIHFWLAITHGFFFKESNYQPDREIYLNLVEKTQNYKEQLRNQTH